MVNRIDVRITRSVQVLGTCFACVMRMVFIFMAIFLSPVASRYVETAMLRNPLHGEWWKHWAKSSGCAWRRMCVKTSSSMNSVLRLATIDRFNGIQICFRHFRVRSKHMPEIDLLSNSIPIFDHFKRRNAFEQIVIVFFSFAPKTKRSFFLAKRSDLWLWVHKRHNNQLIRFQWPLNKNDIFDDPSIFIIKSHRKTREKRFSRMWWRSSDARACVFA